MKYLGITYQENIFGYFRGPDYVDDNTDPYQSDSELKIENNIFSCFSYRAMCIVVVKTLR